MKPHALILLGALLLALPLGPGCGDDALEDGDGDDGGAATCSTWDRIFPEATTDFTPRLAVNRAAGAVIVAGSFDEPIDLGEGPLTTAGYSDAFIASYALDGTLRWAAQYGEDAWEDVYCVAVDDEGGVLIGGQANASTSFGGDPGPRDSESGFVARYAPDGTHLWDRRFVSVGSNTVRAVSFTPDGGVILAADVQSSIDLGGGERPQLLDDSQENVAVVSLDADGNHRWDRVFEGPASERPIALAVDRDGSVVVVGGFQGPLDLGNGSRAPVGGEDAFLLRLDAAGTPLWDRTFGGPEDDRANGVALDAEGGVYVTGAFQQSADFGGGARTAPSRKEDLFFARYGEDGTHVWDRVLGSIEGDRGAAIGVTHLGEVVLYVDAWSELDLGGGILSDQGSYNAFLAGFDASDGAHRWSQTFDEGACEMGGTMGLDPSGLYAIGGHFEDDPVDFGSGPRTLEGDEIHGFVATYDCGP